MNARDAREQSGLAIKIVALAAVVGFLYVASWLMMTVVVSLLLAFLCDPAVSWLGRRGLPRAVGSAIMVTVLMVAFYLLFYLFYAQIQNFVTDFPKYSARLRTHVLKFKERAAEIQKQTETVMSDAEPAGQRRQQETQTPAPWSDYLGAGLRSATEIVFMASFVPFLVYFLLAWKDHLRRNSISLVELGNRMAAERTVDGITAMIRAFVIGNVIIGGILSVASGLLFWFMKLPYPAVMGPVSGFLSIVPYLGVLLAAVPPLVAGLGRYDTLPPLIAIAGGVTGMHIIALNVLYPKLVGSRVHLNPVVVTLALMFWGWLWGGLGLLLAIPITAVVKAVCDNVAGWRVYGRLMAD